jgi:plastocyanin
MWQGSKRQRVAIIPLAAIAGLLVVGAFLSNDSGAESEQVDKEFTVWAKQFSFEPAIIEVEQGDRVRINLRSVIVRSSVAKMRLKPDTNRIWLHFSGKLWKSS